MSFNIRANRYLYQTFGKGQRSGQCEEFTKNANNMITIRSSQMIEELPSVKESKTLFEARQKTKRLYKRFCRLSPFMLRLWDLQFKIKPEIANRNFGNRIKFLHNVTDIKLIDKYVSIMYVQLHEAEHLHSEGFHLKNLCMPFHYKEEDVGFDLYEEKVEKKGKFLKLVLLN